MGPILGPGVPLCAPPFQYHLRSKLGSSRCARWGLCCLRAERLSHSRRTESQLLCIMDLLYDKCQGSVEEVYSCPKSYRSRKALNSRNVMLSVVPNPLTPNSR